MYVGDGMGISQIPFNGSIVSGEIAIIFLFSVFGYQTIGSWGIFQKRRSEENGPKCGTKMALRETGVIRQDAFGLKDKVLREYGCTSCGYTK